MQTKEKMDPRMGAEAITTRIGAVAFPLGIILFVVSTAIGHPSREHPMDNPAVFMEYAQDDSWIAVHFAQWFAALLLVGGLVALTPLRQSLKRVQEWRASALLRRC